MHICVYIYIYICICMCTQVVRHGPPGGLFVLLVACDTRAVAAKNARVDAFSLRSGAALVIYKYIHIYICMCARVVRHGPHPLLFSLLVLSAFRVVGGSPWLSQAIDIYIYLYV